MSSSCQCEDTCRCRKGPKFYPCKSPNHNPPAHMNYPPGPNSHTCPFCGYTQHFQVGGATGA